MSHLRLDQYLSILFVVAALLLLPPLHILPKVQSLLGQNQVSAETSAMNEEKSFPNLQKHLVVPIYVNSTDKEESFPAASASAIYVMDSDSGSVLYQRNAQGARYPASTAKMMTALVARKIYALDKVFTLKQEAFTTGTTAKLQLGEQLTTSELLHALLIPSGNDAAFVFANNHPGGYSGFVGEMNHLAETLHLEKTHFGNPSGLDTEKQTATARDLAILAKELMKDDVLREIVGTKNYTMTDISGKLTHQLQSTQELLGTVDGVVGIKTGTTEFAGENLITQVNREGHSVIIVVLGSQDRFTETKKIIDWTFSNYQWKLINH